MKTQYFLFIFLLFFGISQAQEKLSKEEKARREKNIQAGNPFVKYGSKAPVATLSKGKYLEVHDLDSIVTIGTMRWHVDKKQIVGRIIIDTLNADAQPIGDAPGRWVRYDPLSEEFSSWSPYNMCFDNPMKYVDPDGKAPLDWFKNQQGRVVWFDSKAKGFTDTNGGKWTNVGANTAQVKQSLNVPSNENSSWKTLTASLNSGADGGGREFAAISPIVFKNTAQVSYGLDIKNTGSNGELVSGQSEITGININARVTSETSAPGLQIDGVAGFFGIQQWTPTGKSFTSKSSPFQDLNMPMLSNSPFHATSEANMTLSLKTFNNLTNSSSGSPLGLNLKFNTYTATTNRATQDEEIFKTGN